jgi:hypothetical protein
MLDEDLVSRVCRQDLGESDKSDDQVVEDALTSFSLRALDEARARVRWRPTRLTNSLWRKFARYARHVAWLRFALA